MLAISALKPGLRTAAGIALGMIGAAPLGATTPDRSWIGVQKILVISQLVTPIGTQSDLTAEGLCERVRSIASAGAPVPVACTNLSDPDLNSGRNAVLSFQGAVSDSVPGTKLLIFTIKRAAEAGLEPSPIYFGSTPRAVPLTRSRDSAAVDQAIRASLGQLLPWLGQADTKLHAED